MHGLAQQISVDASIIDGVSHRQVALTLIEIDGDHMILYCQVPACAKTTIVISLNCPMKRHDFD